jgi:hypothetical protein
MNCHYGAYRGVRLGASSEIRGADAEGLLLYRDQGHRATVDQPQRDRVFGCLGDTALVGLATPGYGS